MLPIRRIACCASAMRLSLSSYSIQDVPFYFRIERIPLATLDQGEQFFVLA